MIAPHIVHAIRELLHEGQMSQRGIAKRLGVSRGTVNAIARGKRRERPLQSRMSTVEGFGIASEPVRCPGCGGLVHMPCLLCYVRSIE